MTELEPQRLRASVAELRDVAKDVEFPTLDELDEIRHGPSPAPQPEEPTLSPEPELDGLLAEYESQLGHKLTANDTDSISRFYWHLKSKPTHTTPAPQPEEEEMCTCEEEEEEMFIEARRLGLKSGFCDLGDPFCKHCYPERQPPATFLTGFHVGKAARAAPEPEEPTRDPSDGGGE